MNFLRKGLFALKNNEVDHQFEARQDTKKTNEPVSPSEEGFIQSRINRGDLHALKININRIFQKYREENAANQMEQEEKKAAYRVKLQGLIAENLHIDEQIVLIKTTKKEDVHAKIAASRNHINEIRKNPKLVVQETVNPVVFTLGIILLIGLSIYLFIFYSSASYSAFFKTFDPNSLGIAQAIFDPQAIAKARQDGITELILILTMPSVFLALGYLIHKLLEKKALVNYIKTIGFLMLTFVFDAILGYEITEKIYNLKALASFTESEPYSVSKAFNEPNFWLIIFAGFIVYFVWGLVLEFFADGWNNRNKITVAIKTEEAKIKKLEESLGIFDLETDALAKQRDSNKEQIRKLEEVIEIVIINLQEFEHRLYDYLSGWVEWMHYRRMPEEEVNQARHIAEEFLTNTKRKFQEVEL